MGNDEAKETYATILVCGLMPDIVVNGMVIRIRKELDRCQCEKLTLAGCQRQDISSIKSLLLSSVVVDGRCG